MGVHGLSGFLKRLGLDKDNAATTTTTLSPGTTTLAIDGNGLIFHLFRLSYHRHRKNILSASSSFNTNINTQRHKSPLQAQLLLPTFTPLSLAHDVTTTYLSELTTQHGLHLEIYFDGPDQYMKRHEKVLRKERRLDEWENVRQLCIHGILPTDEHGGGSKFRSSARRQARESDEQRRCNSGFEEQEVDNAGTSATNDDDNEAEVYLSSFPISPLVMDQIERSIHAFAGMSTILPFGSVHIIQCDGEADSHVARASAKKKKDNNGMTTYALACDSDYLIYGYPNEHYYGGGETKYIQFGQIDPSSDALCVGSVLTRSDVAAAMGLPCPGAMVELSILLGNDYTGPFVRCDDMKKRKGYWGSIRWYRDNGEGDAEEGIVLGERLPPEDEMSWFDKQGIADHIAEKKVDGWKLTSDNDHLKLAIQFSYDLYSFGDISSFPSAAPGSTVEECALDVDIDEDIIVFPSLPRGLDMSLARDASNEMDLCEAALLPLTMYMSDVGAEANELQYIEQRHIDAFRLTQERMSSHTELEIGYPQRKMQWADMQSLYCIEKCLLAAIDGDGGAIDHMPCRVFNHSLFHSCLESISFEDFPLDNELVSKNEKAFLEEATSELPVIKDKEEDKNCVLPIDKHKDEILHTIKTQRVTIIHGETGCGKSSRVPCFLLRADPPEPTLTAPEVKMIVSQPRRIAAKALAERVRSCEPDLTDKIGLRMGHGIREYESKKTRAWFVTTGYVVRLLANHPGWFGSHTHLIIDEVHERSVDTDILCLLCRRLLQSHPTIRLVLMSATMAAELYSQYFGSPQPPIHVGARRFPIKEFFVEDLSSQLSLSSKSAKIAQDVFKECEKSRCNSAPSASNMEKLHHLATQIATSVGGNGSSVLIFVPGMADIEAITERIEGLNVPNVSYICLPIHSDVPFEEQMAAFEPAKKGEVKVIIATNAAESSLTLPDVDHVVCLGLCKQITYNRASHRQMLVPTWISRASATQRAGRTGRVREGNVYRLYSRDTLNRYMPPYEAGEIKRIPLDSVILSLREMLNEAVIPILLDCIEPPDIFNIQRSFQSLHASNFITNPTDEGEITSLGSLVVALGIDLTLGAFVGLGIQFGVAAEAIQLAAILSFPKSPWAISSPMYHDTDTFNEIVSKTFVSRCFFDAGLFSEPMAIANLLHDYSACKDRNQFCWKHRVSATRMRHLYGTVESLKRRVADCLSVSSEVLESQDPPHLMHHAKVNILRILQVWLFHDTMIVNSSKNKIECVRGGISVELDGPPIGRSHLLQILDAERHPFDLKNSGKIVQQGRFDPENFLKDKEDYDYFESLDIRFASYVLDKNIDFSFYFIGTSLKLFVPADIWGAPESSKLREIIIGKISVQNMKEVSYLQNTGGGNQRGRRGRACGTWYPITIDSVLANDETLPLKSMFVLSSQLTKSQVKEFKRHVDVEIANRLDSVNSILSLAIVGTKTKISFSISLVGCCEVSSTDLRDLFAAPDLVASVSSSTMRQSVHFPLAQSDDIDEESSNSRPLIKDAPEGARVLSVLASERRRDHFIRFSDESNDSCIDVNLPKKYAINGNRWRRKDGGGMVFVPENCVPMAAIPTKSLELFGCCANTLDLRNACRVEGITMCPPGRVFVGLALLSFGFNPRTSSPIDPHDINEYNDEEKKEAGETSYVVQEALSWIFEKESMDFVQQEQWRVLEALDFHTSCMELGEALECQPDKIKALCALFDGVGGHTMSVWDGYDLSLNAAKAPLRPKPVQKQKRDNEERLSQANTAQPMVVKDHPSPSKPSSEAPKQTFACVECKTIFTTWKKCLKHRDKCCPGTQFSCKKATKLASRLEDNKPPKGPKSKGNQAEAKQFDPPKNANDCLIKVMWACQGCNDAFVKKKKCAKHMEKCCFGLVNKAKPKIVYVCEGCNEAFASSTEGNMHTKVCRAWNPGAAPKGVKKSEVI